MTANAPNWLAYLLKSNFSELPQDSVFVPFGWEINLKTKIRKKIQKDCILSMEIWLFFSQLSKRDSVRSTLAAVVLLRSKIYGIRPWVFHFLSNVNIQAKFNFAIFQVLLFLRSTCCFHFLCIEYGTVWGITQCCSICILFSLFAPP